MKSETINPNWYHNVPEYKEERRRSVNSKLSYAQTRERYIKNHKNRRVRWTRCVCDVTEMYDEWVTPEYHDTSMESDYMLYFGMRHTVKGFPLKPLPILEEDEYD